METNNFSWNAAEFFRHLTESNILARENEFRFCLVSGLEGFEEAVNSMQSTKAFVCVSDTSEGWVDLDNSPHVRRVKSVYMAMRHKVDDMQARQLCLDTMRELFRQFMSVFIQERTRLMQACVYPDSRIRFSEIPKYFFSGCAGAFFNISVDNFASLKYNESEWICK